MTAGRGETVFFRLLHQGHDDKAAALASDIVALRDGAALPTVYTVDPHSFAQIPGSPFAYWVSEAVRELYCALPPLESEERSAKQGLATADDLRFLRGHWEVSAKAVACTAAETLAGGGWVSFAKGGEFSPFYDNIHLVVNWAHGGHDLNNFPASYIRNPDFYFRPGLTWPLRTQRGFNIRPMPRGCIFGHKGPTAFVDADDSRALLSLLGLMNSGAFESLLRLQMAFGSWEVGVIQRTPVPNLDGADGQRLGELARACFAAKRDLDTANETSHVFTLPALLQSRPASLLEALSAWGERVARAQETLARNQAEIDAIAFRLYGISDADRRALTPDPDGAASNAGGGEDEDGDEPEDAGEENGGAGLDPAALADDLVSYAAGCAFGRWDVRLALDPALAPPLQAPFAPLPVCSPAMLVGPDGLPARSGGIASEAWLRARPDAITLPGAGAVPDATIPDAAYPLRVDWDGIMVDDAGHPDDIVERVRDVLRLVWGARAELVEAELCQALGVRDLREHLRNPRRFWERHVKRYSKSRRKAPIYWLLQSGKRSYGLWLAYHRLDADILYKALRNYVDPKIALEQSRLDEQRAGLPRAIEAGGRTRREAERSVERQTALLAELQEFRQTLERAAQLGLTVDHDDGVLLSIAPLHELVPWKPAKLAWDELRAGQYAWSSMANQMTEKGLIRGRRR